MLEKSAPRSSVFALVVALLSACSTQNDSTEPPPDCKKQSNSPHWKAGQTLRMQLLGSMRNGAAQPPAALSERLSIDANAYITPGSSSKMAIEKLRCACFHVYEQRDAQAQEQAWPYGGPVHAEMLAIDTGGPFRSDLHIDLVPVKEGATPGGLRAVLRVHSLTP